MTSAYHPVMSRRMISPTLIGRDTELAALAGAMDRASAGTPVHQLVAGEAGVGKSRLVAEASAAATARGMRVLVGACANIGDGGVPYGPIVDALRTLVRDLDPEELDAVVGSARPDLARLVPALGSADPSQAGAMTESLQPRLLDALLGFLQRLSGRAPVVFVIEDLHWADPATRETVAFLVRQLRSDRVLVVMTFRADELHRRHPLLPWLAEIGRSGQVERLDLVRLDAAQTRDLLAAIFDEAPAQDVVEQIHRRSDGNPFFVEELIQRLIDEGALVEVDGRWQATDVAATVRLPDTIHALLAARIDALTLDEKRLVQEAAVVGRVFWPGPVASLMGAARPGDLDERCAAGVGVDPAGVRDDPDPLFPERREDLPDQLHEVHRVPRLRVAAPLLLEDRHRDLGEVVEGQIVERALLDEADRGVDGVPPETLTVRDAQGRAGSGHGNPPSIQ
jgi:predicted ATPase